MKPAMRDFRWVGDIWSPCRAVVEERKENNNCCRVPEPYAYHKRVSWLQFPGPVVWNEWTRERRFLREV